MEQTFVLRNKFTVPMDYPPAYRAFWIVLKLTAMPDSEEQAALNEQLEAQSDYEEQLEHPEKLIRSMAEFCPKVRPITPYEIEIVERYSNLHRDCALTCQYFKDMYAEMNIIKEKIKNARQAIPEVRREFDTLLKDARIMSHPEDNNVTLAGFPRELLERYNEIAGMHQEKLIDVNTSYIKWWNMTKKFEVDTRKVDEDRIFFEQFVTEFYANHERFTLDAKSFYDDYKKFLKKLKQDPKYWREQQPNIDAFMKEYETLEKEWKEMHEYITKDGLRQLKRLWGN